MLKMLDEFKKFAMRGNVMDMAVGIIIGGAFGKIVNSLVTDIIMPPIGVLLSGIDFSKLSLPLVKAADGSVTSALTYGMFINAVLNFVIVAFAVFLLVRGLNALQRKEATKIPPAPIPVVSPETAVLTEIRDLLRTR